MRKLLGWTVVSAQLFLLALSVLIAARRCVGAVTQPLPNGWLIAVAISVASFSVVSRWCLLRANNAPSVWQRRSGWWLPAATMVSLGIGLTVPGVSTWAVVVFWLIFLGQETACVYAIRWSRREADAGKFRLGFLSSAGTTVAGRESSFERKQNDEATGVAVEITDKDFSLNEKVMQKVVRSETEDGEEIHALLRSVVLAGQRTFWMHLAICPPLREVPVVDLEQVDGPDAHIRVGQVLTSGIRLDVRLREVPCEQQRISVELFAYPRPV